MPKKNNRVRNGRNGRQNDRVTRTPTKALTRTFREFRNVRLNNSTGSGTDAYSYYTEYIKGKPSECTGFREAQQTFEFWRLKNMRVKVQPGFNGYGITYNTINLDVVAAMQLWTVADLSTNESVSSTSILSYNNARCTTLSLNGITTVANTKCKLNDITVTPRSLLPYSTWLDTSNDLNDSKLVYSGVQFYAKIPFALSTDWFPMIQLIVEYDVEFKQPAYQNRPTAFEMDIIGSVLEVQPLATSPDLRSYHCVKYSIDEAGGSYRFIRTDGQPGFLNFTKEEFWDVYFTQKSGSYFDDRPIRYTGPIPRKPLGWQPPVSL